MVGSGRMELRQPPPLELSQGNIADSWRRWEQQFLTYYAAAELSKKEKSTQVAILLHCAGPEAQEVHRTFEFDDSAGNKADEYKGAEWNKGGYIQTGDWRAKVNQGHSGIKRCEDNEDIDDHTKQNIFG